MCIISALSQRTNYCQFIGHKLSFFCHLGILTNIDRRLQMYPFMSRGSFNPRAIGSQDIENYFGEFQNLDPQGKGILRPDDIQLTISVACELNAVRMDADR